MSTPAGLDVAIALRRGALDLTVELRIGARETVALVGPNGAGKSTCLRALAGLERIERGRIACGTETWDAGPAAPFVPPEDRRVGYVFQDLGLFPHLTVAENIGYGLRVRGVPGAEAQVTALLERVGLNPAYAARRPNALSGGEAQRVALARALAGEPRALLLDEPLSAVDASGRTELRRELTAHLAAFGGPRVLVAHDVQDAVVLADRIVVLEAGRVVQSGEVQELARSPRSAYVANLVGLNTFAGRSDAGVVDLGGAELSVAGAPDGPVRCTVHPRAVALFPDRPEGSPRNAWALRVRALEPSLERVRVELEGVLRLVAEITPAAAAELALEVGTPVWATVKATEIGVEPA